METFLYTPEEGYATTIALNDQVNTGVTNDYVLIEGTDRSSLLTADEVSEYTDNGGQYTTGEWD